MYVRMYLKNSLFYFDHVPTKLFLKNYDVLNV